MLCGAEISISKRGCIRLIYQAWHHLYCFYTISHKDTSIQKGRVQTGKFKMYGDTSISENCSSSGGSLHCVG